MSQLLLASASPRRAQLLQQLGFQFIQRATDIPEVRQADESATAYVQRLACEKAVAGWAQLGTPGVALGSDTLIAHANEVMEKPADEDECVRMLLALSNTQHEVHTAVAVTDGALTRTALVTSRVRFRKLTEAECRAYWRSGEPQDKAGAYAIQGMGGRFVSELQGSCSAVVGLPLCETEQLLAQFGYYSGFGSRT